MTDQDPGAALAAALARALERAGHGPVQAIETHISRVLLAGPFAYKLKKPVRLPFLDFSTLQARRRWCDEELRLNRRLAPALYLDVVPIRGSVEAPRLDGGEGPAIEVALRMRRFAPGALLSERVRAGILEGDTLDALARRLAAFHRGAAVAAPGTPYGTATLVAAQLRAAFDAATAGHGEDAPLRTWVERECARLGPAWERRRADGFVRECHGDLHLANAVVLDDGPTAFDCIEFDPALRFIDIQSDVAFLAMDLVAHGREDFAWRFLNAWLDETGDHDGLPVLRTYMAYRALVRAEVARLRGAAHDGPDYLGVARRIAASADARLMVTHGLPGAGKSVAARRIAARAGAVLLRSDIERKRLFGLAPLARSSSAAVYAQDATARTYGRLLALARTALAAGHRAVVDAAFLRAGERDGFRALAAELGVPFAILDCRAPLPVLRQRVRARHERADDASEADEAVLQNLLDVRQPLSAAELTLALPVRDDRADADADAAASAWLRRTALDADRTGAAAPRDHEFPGVSKEHAMYQKILVPVDGSPTSNLGLDEAVRLAGVTGARMHLLHVVDVLSLAIAGEGYTGASGDLLNAVRRAGEDILAGARRTVEAAGVPVDVSLLENTAGRVAELVVDEALRWGADIIVLGTHGRRGVGRLMLGSDAEQVLRISPVPVLLVRAKAKAAERA